jgi:hypothetical protein
VNIYLLVQNENNGWDTYDSCVVVAIDEDDAKTIDPNGSLWSPGDTYSCWARTVEGIHVTLIGVADESQERGVICASFNAG